MIESSTHILKSADVTPAMAKIPINKVKSMVPIDNRVLSWFCISLNWASAKLMDAAAVAEWMGVSPILTKSDMRIVQDIGSIPDDVGYYVVLISLCQDCYSNTVFRFL